MVKSISSNIYNYENTFKDFFFPSSFAHSFNQQICISVHNVPGAPLETGDSGGECTRSRHSEYRIDMGDWVCCLGEVPGGVREFPSSHI